MNRFFVTSLLIMSTVTLNAQWYQQTSGTTMNLTSVHFVNSQTGFICGTNTFLKTTDSGITWSADNFNGEHRSIFFIDQNTGWICGNMGLFKSTDGGNTWNQVTLSSPEPVLNFITFDEVGNGLIIGYNNRNFRTTDFGDTWSVLNVQTGIDFFSAQIISSDVYYVAGAEGTFFISTDGGTTWIDRSLMMPNPFFTISFVTPSYGWLIGCCGMYFKTTDAGLSWTPEFYITNGLTIHGSQFLNQDTGFMVGDGNTIYRTENSSETWESLQSFAMTDYYDVFFINDTTGWAVGAFGTIVKTTNAGGEGTPINITNVSSSIPSSFRLFQNYPNPFNPGTKIRFSVPLSELVTLKVFDVLGREVTTLVNEVFIPGTYEVFFNAENLNNGTYFYKMRAGSYFETKRMVLIK